MTARRVTPTTARFLLALVLATAAATAVPAQSIAVQAAVERTEVFVGEPLRFRIVVSGSDRVTAPDPAGIAGFTVRTLGAGRTTARSSPPSMAGLRDR